MSLDPRVRSRLLAAGPELSAETNRLARRIITQLEFAGEFLGPDDPERPLLAEAASLAQGPDLAEAAAKIEALLAPIGKRAKEHVIHCVGHGHIDMNWMWGWPETAATCFDTFSSVLGIMAEDPDVTFSQSQVSVYEAMERYHPELFAQIVQRVQEGRWEVTAAQWVEGDKNLVVGESLCRHYLEARKWCQDRLGLSPDDVPVQWEPDTFGHAHIVPSLAAQAGVRFYYACRTGGGFDHPRKGEARPPLFRWIGPDGHSVLVCRELTWYNSYVGIGENIALSACRFYRETGASHWMNVYGLGNHGGGPTRKEIAWLRELATFPIYPQVVFSTSRRFFEAAASVPVPEVCHDLNYEFTGCYTSQSLIKQANHLGERHCLEADALLAASGLDASTHESWRRVLFGQFHDILPGSGVQATREHARAAFQEVTADTASIKRRVLLQWGEQMDTASFPQSLGLGSAPGVPFEGGAGLHSQVSGLSQPSGGGEDVRAFLVYNPCAWERDGVVTVRVYDSGFDPSRLVVFTPERIQKPLVIETKNEWGHEMIQLAFRAEAVPGLGCATYWIAEDWNTERPEGFAEAIDGVTLTSPEGTCLFDRYRFGVSELLGHHNVGRWHRQVERPKYMTAWVLGGLESEKELLADRFDLVGEERNPGTLETSGTSDIFLTRQTARLADGGSITVRCLVDAVAATLHFEADLDFREVGTPETGIPGLRIDFEVPGAELAREAPFGFETVEEGMEVPTVRSVHSGDWHLYAESKHGISLNGGVLSLRVVRASFDPDPTPEVGQQTFRYAVGLSKGRLSNTDRMRWAMEQDHALIAVPVGIHPGSKPSAMGHLSVKGGIPTAIKPAEDGSGIIVRLLCFDEGLVTFEGPYSTATLTDVLERPTGVPEAGSQARAKPGVSTFLLRP